MYLGRDAEYGHVLEINSLPHFYMHVRKTVHLVSTSRTLAYLLLCRRSSKVSSIFYMLRIRSRWINRYLVPTWWCPLIQTPSVRDKIISLVFFGKKFASQSDFQIKNKDRLLLCIFFLFLFHLFLKRLNNPFLFFFCFVASFCWLVLACSAVWISSSLKPKFLIIEYRSFIDVDSVSGPFVELINESTGTGSHSTYSHPTAKPTGTLTWSPTITRSYLRTDVVPNDTLDLEESILCDEQRRSFMIFCFFSSLILLIKLQWKGYVQTTIESGLLEN